MTKLQILDLEENFGNAYHVANSNWHTIHNPISIEMLTTGEDIPDELGDDDVYYKSYYKYNFNAFSS